MMQQRQDVNRSTPSLQIKKAVPRWCNVLLSFLETKCGVSVRDSLFYLIGHVGVESIVWNYEEMIQRYAKGKLISVCVYGAFLYSIT